MKNQVQFKHFGTMIDCSRNAVMNVKTLKKWIDLTADLGYNTLCLYMEDTYEVADEPYFGYLRGRYSKEELKEIDEYAKKRGMEIIPCIQTLAHLNQMFRWPKYRSYNDTDDILLIDNEDVYTLIDRCFQTLAECFSTKTINIGMDEAFMMGRGRYFNLHGNTDRAELFLKHLNRVAKIGEKYGFTMLMWSDMFFNLLDEKTDNLAEVQAKIPNSVKLVYWDYYSTEKKNYDEKITKNQRLCKDAWFAGGLWSWTGFAPHNVYSIETTKAAFESCMEHGVSSVFLTLWGDNGGECSRFALLPSLFYASELAKGNHDESLIKAKFQEKYGIAFDEFMWVDLPVSSYNAKERTCNPDKYILYNDPLTGIMDSAIWDSCKEEYTQCAQSLAKIAEHSDFGFLFKTLKALCEVLAVKGDLGIQTRAAYKAGDKKALQALLCRYEEAIEKTEVFYRSFRAQWYLENKPHGFNVQDVRIGGVIMRLKNGKALLEEYLDGKMDRIEELEEELLNCADFEVEPKKAVTFARWDEMTSVCKF